MSEHPRYEIKTVADFLKVPAERRAACLAEFPRCLEYMEAMRDFLNALTPEAKAEATAFVWIDDGDTKLRSITVTGGDEECLRLEVNYE